MFLATTLGSPFGWSSSFALPYLSCFLWPLRPGWAWAPVPWASSSWPWLCSSHDELGQSCSDLKEILGTMKGLGGGCMGTESWRRRAGGEAVGQSSGPGLVDLQSTYQEGAVWCPVFGKPGCHNWRFFWRRKAQIKAISWERQNWYLQCQGDIYSKKLRGPLKNFDVGTISPGARSTIQAIKDEMEKW